jgi:hypothetical protein
MHDLRRFAQMGARMHRATMLEKIRQVSDSDPRDVCPGEDDYIEIRLRFLFPDVRSSR